MTARYFSSLVLVGIGLTSLTGSPHQALANGLIVPGYGAADAAREQPLPYRAAPFPPPQHDIFGQDVPPPDLYARPTYRESQFPPERGRYGGGFIEYVLTGEPESLVAHAPQPVYAAPPPQPVYAQPAYGHPAYARPQPLHAHSALPEYSPQPPAYYGAAPGPHGSIAEPVANQPTQTASYDPIARDPGLASRPIDPVFQRQEVDYSGHERAGTIVIDTPRKFLFLVQPGGRALRYGIGVGRPGFAWAGVKSVTRKAEWPDWTPPAEMLLRRPDLPRHMAGGPANPLGARALYLGSSLYRIHGTNEPYTIGANVSSGCIRMMNEDVVDLYGRVGVGARVIVM